ncbi:MAG TPA: spermine/spermidine synthase [bacterium]
MTDISHTDPVPSGREIIERARTPTGDWQLQRRGPHYEIIANGTFLMATYNRASDEALAVLALARVQGERLRVLVGGLGIGFTVRAVLDDPRVSRCDVVEIEPLIVAWYEQYTAAHSGRPLDDPRAHLVVGDLGLLSLATHAYDAVLLDTDNGPDWLALDANARLYDAAGIVRSLDLLRPGGIAAYWSASASPAFAARLSRLADVETMVVADEIAPGREGTAWVYLARSRS